MRVPSTGPVNVYKINSSAIRASSGPHKAVVSRFLTVEQPNTPVGVRPPRNLLGRLFKVSWMRRAFARLNK